MFMSRARDGVHASFNRFSHTHRNPFTNQPVITASAELVHQPSIMLPKPRHESHARSSGEKATARQLNASTMYTLLITKRKNSSEPEPKNFKSNATSHFALYRLHYRPLVRQLLTYFAHTSTLECLPCPPLLLL